MEMVYTMNQTLPNLKDKPYGGAWSIHDSEIKSFIKDKSALYPQINVAEFLNNYKSWLTISQNLYGFNSYNYLTYSNGTTEAFDKFYQKYSREDRRLRLWKGEYFYHQIQARENFTQFAWINEDSIVPNDVVVVSAPFSDTGSLPQDFDSVMQQCCDLKVPVLLDMAYLSLTKDFYINLDYPCIETITTSLSKVFPVEHMRIGIRLNRHKTDDTLDAYCNQATPYVNTIGVYIGNELIKKFPQQYVNNKWESAQLDVCKQLDVEPSNCVIFGIDTKNLYKEYNRGGNTNRLCFSNLWGNRNDTLHT